MKLLLDTEQKDAEKWMYEAVEVAKNGMCLKGKRGTVIVKGGEIIGRGYSAPPLDKEENQTCANEYTSSKKRNFDRTCCMHAEWRAIIDALKNNADKISGSRLYFVSVDERGDIQRSGQPYCTVCSRFALDTGIAEFLLWHEEGICSYPTDEYNRLSYEYFKV
jgi:deoxycytidylate deaminase